MGEDRPRVLLLRSRDDPDPYEELLRAAGFEPTFMPVLEFEWVQQDELRELLAHPRRFEGLILTSPRAVQALADAMSWLPSEVSLWQAKLVYAVGPRTATDLRALGFDPIGEETGRAELLVERIAERTYRRPLLFLCGDRRRDVVPTRLRALRIPLEELCVYHTSVIPNLDLSEIERPDWIVLFSPSGVEALSTASDFDPTKVRIATIGDTTAAAVADIGWQIDAVAEHPSAESIVAAIRAVDYR